MSRDGSGVYSLPENPFVAGTPILSAEVNSDFDDVADALTGSVASDGQTQITGGLQGFAGTVALPGYAFAGDLDTGMYRSAANTIGLAAGGVLRVSVTASGIAVVGTVTATNGLLPFPSGTAMLFVQTAAPTGWTKSVVHNDKALRIVSGTVTTGGSVSFSNTLTSRTIAQANLPSFNLSLASVTASVSSMAINHRADIATGGGIQGAVRAGQATSAPTDIYSSSTLVVGGTLPSGGSGTAMDFNIQYVDCTISVKD